MQHSANQPGRPENPLPNSPDLILNPSPDPNISPVHICLATCDKHVYWLQGRSFVRKFIPEPDHAKTSPSKSSSASTSASASNPHSNSSNSNVPFNADCGGGGKTHLCYVVHQREDGTYPRTCILNAGSPIVQIPSLRTRTDRTSRNDGGGGGNVFDSLYWRRCDGTVRNALDEVLVSSDPESVDYGNTSDCNSNKALQTSMSMSMSTARLRDVLEPKMNCVSERDLAKFERWKDAFVERFM